MTATSERPTKSTTMPAVPSRTTRRSPVRLTRRSPAKPDAASMPVRATAAITAAKTVSSHSGVSPSSIDSVTTEGSKSSSIPKAMIAANSTTLASDNRVR
jgi:hypothetical protein